MTHLPQEVSNTSKMHQKRAEGEIYRPIKPIWRWQGRIAAKSQHFTKRHVWYFPQFRLCFLQRWYSMCSHGGYWFSYHAAKPPTVACEIGDIFKQGANGLETDMEMSMLIFSLFLGLRECRPFKSLWIWCEGLILYYYSLNA